MKPKLFFVGSSHSKRLHTAFKESILQDKFQLIDLSKGGSVFSSTITAYPKVSTLKEGDIVVIQTFGNDLFTKNIEFLDDPTDIYRLGPKIHLRKCVPKSLEKIRTLHQKLIDIISRTPNEVILVDCVYRYLCGYTCQNPNHNYPGLLSFQSKHNKTLYKDFGNIPNVQVIRHINCMPGRAQNWKTFDNYKNLLVDHVHLKTPYYLCIAEDIWNRIK